MILLLMLLLILLIRDLNKIEKKSVLDFFCKAFFFFSVFKLPPLRNTRKRDKTKKSRGTDIEKCCRNFGKVFDMDFFVKNLYGVFELPLPRNAQKRNKTKKPKGKKVGRWVGGSGI
jgi:hypothetical protein